MKNLIDIRFILLVVFLTAIGAPSVIGTWRHRPSGKNPMLFPIKTIPYVKAYTQHFRGVVGDEIIPFRAEDIFFARDGVIFGWLYNGKIRPIYDMEGHMIIYDISYEHLDIPTPELLEKLGVYSYWPPKNGKY